MKFDTRKWLACVLLSGFTGCWAGARASAELNALSSTKPATKPATRPSYVVGKIDSPLIDESSGVVASRRFPGVFWTHNDSGNASQLFAITRTGKLIKSFDVAAMNVDWEDITVDDTGHVYLADIGNNNGWRSELTVYKLDEPDPLADESAQVDMKPDGKGATTVDRRLKILHAWKLGFPAGVKPFDCESLFIWKSDGYVISKLFNGSLATLYKFPLDDQEAHTLERVVQLPIRSPCTGADLSVDGKQLAVVTNFGPSLFTLPAAGDFSKLDSTVPAHITWIDPTMEAVCFAPKTSDAPAGVMTTAEGRTVCLFPFEAFGKPDGVASIDPTRVTIGRASDDAPPVIDGALDEWDEHRDAVPLRSLPADAAPARLMARWSTRGIYLAGVVPTRSVKPLSKAWFAGDCVEVFLGQDEPGRTPEYRDDDDRCYIGFARAGTKDKPELGELQIHWPRREDAGSTHGREANVAGRVNPDGTWQFEAFLSFSTRRGPLNAGDSLCLNVSMLSRGPKANWFISQSNESGTWISPLTWAKAELK